MQENQMTDLGPILVAYMHSKKIFTDFFGKRVYPIRILEDISKPVLTYQIREPDNIQSNDGDFPLIPVDLNIWSDDYLTARSGVPILENLFRYLPNGEYYGSLGTVRADILWGFDSNVYYPGTKVYHCPCQITVFLGV
jgi:hypothetical protein